MRRHKTEKRKYDKGHHKGRQTEPAKKTIKTNNDESNVQQLSAVCNLADAIEKQQDYKILMNNCYALVNSFTNYKLRSVQDFLLKKWQDVRHTSQSSLQPPLMSVDQFIQACLKCSTQMDHNNMLIIHVIDKSIDHYLIRFKTVPKVSKTKIMLVCL